MSHGTGLCPGYSGPMFQDGECYECWLAGNGNFSTKTISTETGPGGVERSQPPRICLHLIPKSLHRNAAGKALNPLGFEETCEKKQAWECRLHGTATKDEEVGGFPCCEECPDKSYPS